MSTNKSSILVSLTYPERTMFLAKIKGNLDERLKPSFSLLVTLF